MRPRWLPRFRRRPTLVEGRPAYAKWAASYPPEPHNRLMELETDALRALLPPVRGLRVVDLACGSGRYLAELRREGPARAIGLDLSPEMLARAKAVGAPLAVADLRALPLREASVDVAVCALAVGDVEDLAGAVAEIGRALAPGGILVYSDVHPVGALSGWQRTFRGDDGRRYAVRHHVHLYADHHAACCAAGLVIDAVREPRVDVEGPWRGYPAVLVIRARRVA